MQTRSGLALAVLGLTLLLSPSTASANAELGEESSSENEDLATMSLDEVSRKLENPLAKLWSLTCQENLSLNQGDRADGTKVSNNFFFQPFLPIPVGESWMLTMRPVFPLVTNSVFVPGEDGTDGHETGLGDIQMLSLFGPDNSNGWVSPVNTSITAFSRAIRLVYSSSRIRVSGCPKIAQNRLS